MKITFITNYMTHHQLPFAKYMEQSLGEDFLFISTMPIEPERVQGGWKQNELYSFELRAYENVAASEKAKCIALDSDIVIIGSAPDEYIIPRLKQKKLTFKYSERPFKKGIHLNNLFHLACGAWLHHGLFQYKPLYMLCASGYAASDFAVFGCYKNKCFEWGYFPEVKRYTDVHSLITNKRPASILWAARLIELKHPDAAIQVAKRLMADGFQFQMNIIGNGELESLLRALIVQEGLSDCVRMLGVMPPETVREYMEQSEIFLFTSDFNEGWGAVLNESMNSACAVVASHAIGSVPFLIKNRQNGLVYENENIKDLYQKTKWLLENPKQRVEMAANAYSTIADQWNAESATQRLLALCDHLLKEEPIDYLEGPCSRAPVIVQKQMYQYLIKE